MDNALVFLYAGYIVSIILLVLAGIINPIYIIRLQIKQAEVKNGLAKLRKQQLAKGIVTEVVVIVALLSLTGRFFIHDPSILRYTITIAIVCFAIFVLTAVIIEAIVYNQSYTERDKEIHSILAKIESGEYSLVDKKKKKMIG